MKKILVNVEVPAISRSIDVYIPDFLPIKNVILLISRGISELSDNLYTSSGEELLCSKEKKIVLAGEYNLAQYGIQNGDTLILM